MNIRRFAMVSSPLSVILCGFLIVGNYSFELVSVIVLNLLWVVVEFFIASKQDYRGSVPSMRWITASRFMWVLSVMLTFMDMRLGITTVTVPVAVSVSALALMAFGVALRLFAFIQLGKYFTYDIRVGEDHRLVTEGIYSVIRHPAYLAVCILGTMPAVVVGSVSGFFFLAVFTVPQTVYRLNLEDRMLERSYGDDYLLYKRKSYRLIPFVY